MTLPLSHLTLILVLACRSPYAGRLAADNLEPVWTTVSPHVANAGHPCALYQYKNSRMAAVFLAAVALLFAAGDKPELIQLPVDLAAGCLLSPGAKEHNRGFVARGQKRYAKLLLGKFVLSDLLVLGIQMIYPFLS